MPNGKGAYAPSIQPFINISIYSGAAALASIYSLMGKIYLPNNPLKQSKKPLIPALAELVAHSG
jgi:hypothetical protein